jgi:hypothetical protein
MIFPHLFPPIFATIKMVIYWDLTTINGDWMVITIPEKTSSRLPGLDHRPGSEERAQLVDMIHQ